METWSSRLGVGRGADNPTPEKNYCHETFSVKEAKAHPGLGGGGRRRRRRYYPGIRLERLK
jgi:hypothetical protein